jgi:uncharacterized membrane protein
MFKLVDARPRSRHILCNYLHMEKRFLGIILAVLGIAGLIFATVNFISGGSGSHHVRQIIGYGVLGLIFFVAGVGLIRTTKDKPS